MNDFLAQVQEMIAPLAIPLTLVAVGFVGQLVMTPMLVSYIKNNHPQYSAYAQGAVLAAVVSGIFTVLGVASSALAWLFGPGSDFGWILIGTGLGLIANGFAMYKSILLVRHLPMSWRTWSLTIAYVASVVGFGLIALSTLSRFVS